MKILNKIFSRIVIVGTLVIVQILWFVYIFTRLSEYYKWINACLTLFSFIAVLLLVRCNTTNPSVKLPWVILIVSFPLFGGLLYLTIYERKPTRWLRRKLEAAEEKLLPFIIQDHLIMEKLSALDLRASKDARYLIDYAASPVYENTETAYYPSGEAGLPVMLAELEKAEHFIFMEYFEISLGSMWDSIFLVLKKKAEAGVDVRVIYDDVGSILNLPYHYDRFLEKHGIRCEAFNHFKPFVSIVMNNRDHRKILVIDGHTGFSGGINIGDQYINKVQHYGYWKDTCILLKGDAVWKLTEMFLATWNSIRPTDQNYTKFMPHSHHPGAFLGSGFVQPFGDSPLDDESVGENIYINMINSAVESLYICNPYIVIDNEIMTALCLSAKRGVKVTLITPGINDSKTVDYLDDTYFPQLIESGVQVYAYEPGFIHAKVLVCDEKTANVGTVNLDYRSLYHHFECGVLLYHTDSVQEILADMKEALTESRLITKESLRYSLPRRMIQMVLRIFAPLI